MSTVEKELKWDGKSRSYRPVEPLAIDPSLRLCESWEEDLDPVTFEVVRHALWNINIEHGEAIIRVSGSPQAVFSHDFNPALITATGEYVFSGPYIQVHAGVLDLVVKWTLENRSGNPGIEDGDMFLSNDPWIGAHHQEDVILTAPVFWEGELLCWVANVFHQHDLGGVTPGGYCPDARDAFDEPGCIPPIKMVERGRIRADIEDEYRRRSREPELLGLDLRAMIAGCNVARDRVLDICRRYGPGVVRASFEKIIADSERVVGDRLERIPDGRWQAQAFIECKEPGDRGIYKGMLTVEKSGRRITLSNRGTDPQTGAINTTFSAWRSAVLSVLNPFLCFDLMYAVGGALRCVDFDPEPGTITCADHPAAVSNTSGGALMSVTLATSCLGRMLSFDAELRQEIFAVGANSAWPLTILGGRENGSDFATVQLDAMGGGYGAFPWRDGMNTGGMVWDPKSAMPNIEYTEQYYPVLYLYRREQADSGGAGRFRGGVAGTFALAVHGAEDAWFSTSTSGVGVLTAQGIAGGYPGVTTRLSLAREADLSTRLAQGELPLSIDDLGGELSAIMPKESRLAISEDDAIEVSWSGPAGYGDPLERDLERVLADVRDGYVTERAAASTYGVVIANDEVDVEATNRLRREQYAERRKAAGPAAQELDPGFELLGESTALGIYGDQGTYRFGCLRCRTDLGPIDGNYKDRCRSREVEPRELSDLYPDGSVYVDEPVVVRQSICPGCERLLDSEILRSGEEPLHDVCLNGWS